jgi:hypothetical protein
LIFVLNELLYILGLVGEHSKPDHLRLQIDGTIYRIWVEQRGRNQVSPSAHVIRASLADLCVKFGLIPTDESGTYTNTFIGVSEEGTFKIEDEWQLENGTVWVVSTKWAGQPGA